MVYNLLQTRYLAKEEHKNVYAVLLYFGSGSWRFIENYSSIYALEGSQKSCHCLDGFASAIETLFVTVAELLRSFLTDRPEYSCNSINTHVEILDGRSE